MNEGLKRVLINLAIVVGGGWLLTSMNFVPWFAIGIPLVIALSLPQMAPKPKPLSFAERHPRLASDAAPSV